MHFVFYVVINIEINIDPPCVGHILKLHIYIFSKQSIWHVVGAPYVITPFQFLIWCMKFYLEYIQASIAIKTGNGLNNFSF